MKDDFDNDTFSENLQKFAESPELESLINELFTSSMLELQVGSSEVQEYFDRLDLMLTKLEKDEAVKLGRLKIQ